MDAIFEAITHDPDFAKECKKNPIYGATFYALRKCAQTENGLSELSWFDNITTKRKITKLEIAKAA